MTRRPNGAPFAALVALVAGGLGCAHTHAYFSASLMEPIIDLDAQTGRTTTIPRPNGGSVIVGLAYNSRTDLLYARVAPGNRVLEVRRATGQVLRDIAAGGVPVGCGYVSHNVDGNEVIDSGPSCGLAIRETDGHLFLDDPNAASGEIYEVDLNGRTVNTIRVQQSVASAVGGLGYHQRRGTLFVLHEVNRTIYEVDMTGHVLNQFNIDAVANPSALDVDSVHDRLVAAGLNGTDAWFYDLQGHKLLSWPLNRSAAGAIGGIGVGDRPAWPWSR